MPRVPIASRPCGATHESASTRAAHSRAAVAEVRLGRREVLPLIPASRAAIWSSDARCPSPAASARRNGSHPHARAPHNNSRTWKADAGLVPVEIVSASTNRSRSLSSTARARARQHCVRSLRRRLVPGHYLLVHEHKVERGRLRAVLSRCRRRARVHRLQPVANLRDVQVQPAEKTRQHRARRDGVFNHQHARAVRAAPFAGRRTGTGTDAELRGLRGLRLSALPSSLEPVASRRPGIRGGARAPPPPSEVSADSSAGGEPPWRVGAALGAWVIRAAAPPPGLCSYRSDLLLTVSNAPGPDLEPSRPAPCAAFAAETAPPARNVAARLRSPDANAAAAVSATAATRLGAWRDGPASASDASTTARALIARSHVQILVDSFSVSRVFSRRGVARGGAASGRRALRPPRRHAPVRGGHAG